MTDDYMAEIVKRVAKKLGPDKIRLLSDGAKSEVTEVVPTGIAVIDNYVLGVGGLPVGRMVELFSEEGSGKTSLAWQALGACQKAGGVGVLVESESAISEERAKLFGVDPDKLLLVEPDNLEDAFERMEEILKALPKDRQAPNLWVWDSLAATATKAEIEDGMIGDAAVAERARLMSRVCRVLGPLLPQTRTAALWINQIRANIGVMFGDKTMTPGGKAVKFYASARLSLLGGKKVDSKDSDEHAGKDITVLAVKNKLATPWRKARVRLNYRNGWDDAWSTFQFAKLAGYIESKTKLSDKACEAARMALEANGWELSGMSEDDE